MKSGTAPRLCLLMSLALPVLPSPLFTWQFDKPGGTVDTNAAIDILAALTNTGASPLGGPVGDPNHIFTTTQSLFSQSFRSAYDFLWDSSALLGLNQTPLPPAQSMDFVAGTFTPMGSSVAPGVFPADSATPSLNGGPDVAPSNGFTRTAAEMKDSTPQARLSADRRGEIERDDEREEAPEPSTAALLAGGLIAAGLRLRRKRS